MSSHLEFLGYKITRTENSVKAESPTFPRVIQLSERSGGIMFTVNVNCSEKAKCNRLDFLEWLNTINRRSSLLTVCSGEENILTLATWYPTIYNRGAFSSLFQVFRDDIRAAIYGKDAKTDEYLL
jgi:hypothetical protein